MNRNTLTIGLCLMVTLALAACTTEITPQVTTPVQAQAIVTPTSELPTESIPAQQGPTSGQIDFGIPTRAFIPSEIKPPLSIDPSVNMFQSPAQFQPEVSQVIGFTFPDGTIAVKAAPYDGIYSSTQDAELTPVGVVAIGEGGTNPGTYEVNLDLEGSAQCVSGELRQLENGGSNPLPVRFVRISQKPNPERVNPSETEWPAYADEESPTYNSAVITADGVCFVLKLGESYFRYCSEPGSSLSAKNNEAQYSNIVASIRNTAEIFGLQNDIEYSQTISTLEDSTHIDQCAGRSGRGSAGESYEDMESCSSDVIVAPVKSLVPNPTPDQNPCEPTPTPTAEPEKKTCKSPYTVRYGEWVWKIGRRCNISPYAIIDANGLVPPYWLYPGDVLILPRNAPPFPGRPQSSLPTSQFAFAWGSLPFSGALASFSWQEPPTTTPISVTVGVVKVLRDIDIGGGNVVLPGDYRVDYWFEANNNFLAATLSGIRNDDVIVTNQQIPAVPAAFINADGTEFVNAQISACRIFRRCVFFQRHCP